MSIESRIVFFETIAELKAFDGTANVAIVEQEAHQGVYFNNPGATADEVVIYDGTDARKWQRIIVPEIEEALNANQGVWGSFTGDLEDQEDLQDALDALTASIASVSSTLTASKQNLDSDLTAIAALSPSNDDIIQRKSGAWTNRTVAQLKTDLTLAKADVGLENADNTSDVDKPVSTATQAALDTKEDVLISGTNIKTINSISLLGSGDIPISLPTRVFIGGDVANSTTSFANITSLQFPVVAGEKYEFKFFIVYNSAATTTGAAFSINGPTLTSTNYTASASLSTTSVFRNVRASYDAGTETSNSILTGNIATIEGVIQCSASGNVVARFKSGVAASAITVKAGNTYVSYSKIN